MQVWNENDEQEEVLAMVAQTGERTIMGRMMQSLRDEQQPSARFTVGGFDTKVALLLCLMLLCCLFGLDANNGQDDAVPA